MIDKIRHAIGWYGWYRRNGYGRLEALYESIMYVW